MKVFILLFGLFIQGRFAASSDCNRDVTVASGTQGVMTSPGFPSQYQHLADCTYTIGAQDASSHVNVEFTVFGVEEHGNCEFDYLEIYDGPTKQSTKLGRYCGSDKPPVTSSSGRFITVFFKSDQSVNEVGFSFKYSAGCASTFTETSHVITSPGYPGDYPSKTDCVYTLAPSDGSQFLVSVLHLSIEDSPHCNYDYLHVDNGAKGNYNRKYCGDRDPFKFLVNGTEMNFRFVSDASVSRDGFQISYKMTTSCADNNGGCEHSCNDVSKGKVYCSCPSGYQLDSNGIKCKDVDECVESKCSERCVNTPGSFHCECTTKGFLLAPDGLTCTDKTCKEGNGGCEHVCQPSGNGQYHCACFPGYKLNDDNHNCTDIDECLSLNDDFQHKCSQICHNQAGSYYCECGDGFTLSHNGRTCEDVDECYKNEHVCDHFCVNTPGSWTCACDPGYEIDPEVEGSCIDIDECAKGLAPEVCTHCVNYEGGYECSCPRGYNPNHNSTNCDDINECLTNNGGCNQVCLNKPGSYMCSCNEGFRMNEHKTCVDINECATNNGNGPCDHYCENLVGSYECSCLTGFNLQGDKLSCKDIDECVNNTECQQDCNNTPGSYNCQCYEGYKENKGGECVDFDECSQSPCDSHQDSQCSNSIGSFSCSCPSGYLIHNRTVCVDVDECSNGDHNCEQVCTNLPGSFKCSCHEGFAPYPGNSSICQDVDECSIHGLCDQLCYNSIGSYDCDCNEGYFLLDDGKMCSDVNECTEQTDNCEQICINHIGRHSCDCRSGFTLNSNNYTCDDVNECKTNASGCSDEDHCINIQGSFFCFCDNGYMLDTDNKTCIDNDECLRNKGGCDHICTNTVGSFQCGCDPGFAFEAPTTCRDINECDVTNGNCSQTCNNFDGGYNCTCGENFKLMGDARTCQMCPTCETFTELQEKVSSVLDLKENLSRVLDDLMRLSADVAELKSKVAVLESNKDAK